MPKGSVRLTSTDFEKVIRDAEQLGYVPKGYKLDYARPDDLDDLALLTKACFDYDAQSRRELNYFLVKAHAAFFVFRRISDLKLSGYVLLEANSRTRAMYGNTTCVHPDCQGAGLGRASYYMKQRVLKLLGYNSINAHVAVDNEKTIHLLQKYGFKIVNKVKNYYYDNGNDAYRMKMSIRDI